MIRQFVEHQFAESYYPTIESTFVQTITYNATPYDCELIDTAGQVRKPLLAPSTSA